MISFLPFFFFCCCSGAQLCPTLCALPHTPWTAACQASLSFTISQWPHGLQSPWNSPGQHTGVGSLSLFQGIFPTQGSNPGLSHCRWILYHLSYQGHHHHPELAQTHVHWVSDAVQPSHPLPSIFLSTRVFSNELALRIRWPKYWSFSFSISPSSEYSGLISFRMDRLDLLAIQGTLKSLLQTTIQKHQFFCAPP